MTKPQTIAAVVLALVTAPAHAQAPQCAGVTDALAALATNYGETIRMDALMTGGQVMVITASPSGGWTALIVTPDGRACIVAAGEAFEVHEPEPQGTDM